MQGAGNRFPIDNPDDFHPHRHRGGRHLAFCPGLFFSPPRMFGDVEKTAGLLVPDQADYDRDGALSDNFKRFRKTRRYKVAFFKMGLGLAAVPIGIYFLSCWIPLPPSWEVFHRQRDDLVVITGGLGIQTLMTLTGGIVCIHMIVKKAWPEILRME